MDVQNGDRFLKVFFGSLSHRRRASLAAGFLLILLLSTGCLRNNDTEQEQVSTQIAQTLANMLTGTALSTSLSSSPTATLTPTPPSLTPTLSPVPPSKSTGTPTLTPVPCNQASMIGDVTIPAGTVLNQGVSFIKTWRLQNIGSCSWTTGYALVFYTGNLMDGPAVLSLPYNVNPGGTIDLSVNLTAPDSAGTYQGGWMLRDSNGILFGVGADARQTILVQIMVSNEPFFAVTRVVASVNTFNYTGVCPATFTFSAKIYTNGAGTVTYYWVRSDGSKSAEQALTYNAASSQTVWDTWSLGSSGAVINGWEKLYINAPNHQTFDPATFSMSCYTSTSTSTFTPSPTDTRTKVPTATFTPVPTKTSNPTSTATGTSTPKPTVTSTTPPTSAPAPSETPLPMPTATQTLPASPTPTENTTLTLTETPAATETFTPSPTEIITPTPAETETPSPIVIETETPTPPTAIPSPTATPTLGACNSYPSGGILPSQNSWVDQSKPDTTHGKDPQLHIRQSLGEERLALIQFDLSSIPAGSKINSTILYINNETLNIKDETGKYYLVEFRRVTSPWDESVTRNTQPTIDSTSSGGFILTKDPCVRAGYVDPTLIQAWLDSPTTNYGLALYSPSGVRDVSLTSMEGTLPPLLIVSYSPPSTLRAGVHPSSTLSSSARSSGASEDRLPVGEVVGVLLFFLALSALVAWRVKRKRTR